MIHGQRELDKILSNDKNLGKSLLLHSCCGPCSLYVLTYLVEYFNITVFYYNPNIHPEVEYQKRMHNQIKAIDRVNGKYRVNFVEGDYNVNKYYDVIKGCEHLGEHSLRCKLCIGLRLKESANYASLNGFDYFASTLSVSPHKNALEINELGYEFALRYQVNYLPNDFKKKAGYQESVRLSKTYDIYRQSYCGCIYSKRESER